MADTLTKSVAARLPLDAYVKVITTAAEMKMTVSDYLIGKLFSPERTAELEAQLVTVGKELDKVKGELSKEKTRATAAEKQTADLSGKLKEAENKLTTLLTTSSTNAQKGSEQVKMLNATITQLKADIVTLQGKLAEQEKLVSATVKRINDTNDTAKGWKAEADKQKAEADKYKKAAADAQKKMQDLRAELVEKDNDSMRITSMPDKFWTIIDKYIPATK